MLPKIKVDVLQQAQAGFYNGLFAGTSGNLSARDFDSGHIVITPTSIRYETMTTDDLVVLDLDGNIVAGKHKPSSEAPLHLEVYRRNPEVGAVVHTHSPFATGFAAGRREIPLILTEMIPFLGGAVICLPPRAPGSVELAEETAAALVDRPVCLIGHHGVMAVGKDLAEAYIRAEYVEDAAKVATYAIMQGGYATLPEDLVREIRGE